jgi:hypothetical protein
MLLSELLERLEALVEAPTGTAGAVEFVFRSQ